MSAPPIHSAVTLTAGRYADVHYYFGEPGPRPANHRFDKESYVYLYGDARARKGRIEIANHAGTAEQDAFTGCRITTTLCANVY